MSHVSWLNSERGFLMLGDLLPQLSKEGIDSTTAVLEFNLPGGWTIASNTEPDKDKRYLVSDVDRAVFFLGRSLRGKSMRIDSTELVFVSSGEWAFADSQALKVAGKVLKEYSRITRYRLTSKPLLMLAPFSVSAGPERWSAETRGPSVVLVLGNNARRNALLGRLGVVLTHELFHLWVPNSFHLDGDYDWFFEGFTLYQALLTARQLGFISFEDYLDTLGRVYDSYCSSPDHDKLSLIEASERRWTTSWSLVYDKGMLVAMAYDLMLRRTLSNVTFRYSLVIMEIRFAKLVILLMLLGLGLGCNTLAKKSDSGVVVARRAQIRSSTAVVAADLLEVNRGDVVDVLESQDVQDPSDSAKKERWLRVRARDEENTEGWIESRNIMPDDVLEASRKLAEEDKGVSAQATGQLRASSNLRLTPDRSGNENIMMRLDTGSSFDIVGWKRVPKPKASEAIESDVAPKAGSAQPVSGRGTKERQNEDLPEDTNELWYKVRLGSSSSPAPGGWIYGKQVELTVPSDIIFYRTGREFVAWQRLDGDSSDSDSSTRDKNAGREAKPGSWIILEKSSSNQPRSIDEPDFDRIYVVGYDKRNQEHYTAYRSADVKGYLPLRIEGRGENRTFTIRVQDENGQMNDARYNVYKDARGILKVAAQNASNDSKSGK